MKKFSLGAALLASVIAMPMLVAGKAQATPCLASPTCSLDGETFTTTGGTSGGGVTFIASFTTSGQSPSGIATLVDDYLGLLGHSVTFLGRAGDSSTYVGGDSISVTGNGNTSGTWTFSPGSTGDIAAFVAIHAGDGQNDILYSLNTSDGLSGNWATNNGHGLSNFDVFGVTPTTAVPEPVSLALLGSGLIALGLVRRRRG